MTRHFLAIAACAAVVASGPVTAQGPSPCARLATQIDLLEKTAPPRYGENVAEYRRDLVGGLKGALFGGSASASFKVEPVDETYTSEELEEQCRLAKKGAQCNLKGPIKFTVRTLDREGSVDMVEGERAYFEMRNTKLICRDTV